MADAKHIADGDLSVFRPNFFGKLTEPDSNGCRTWMGLLNNGGYGRFFAGDGREFRAHRVAFALGHNTPLPGVVMVCHRCDNPACCEPSHLFIGLGSDNMRDAVAKGRQVAPRSTHNGNAKLDDHQVLEILKGTESGAKTARRYGVSQALVSMIRSRKRRMVGDTSFELVTYRV